MSDSADDSDAARMELTPDTIHEEGEQGPYLDCPSCGSSAPLELVIEEGHCTGTVEGDIAESEDTSETVQEGADPESGGCGAKLSLELVWEA